MAEFRPWTQANRCPVCGGWPWAGRSAGQCRGGQRADRPRVAWCSVRDSGRPSRSGKCWEWWLDRPYEWVPEPDTSPGIPRWRQTPHVLPPGLRAGRHWEPVAEWQYHYPGHGYCYSVLRFEHAQTREKTYRSGVHAPRPGPTRRFQWGLEADERIPYRLPELLSGIAAGRRVWICEGEKSADALAELGEVATCNPGGSAQWGAMPEPERWLAGAQDIRVVVDRDQAGLRWAADVVATLKPLGAQITLLRSATQGPGDDVADHIQAGFSLAELEEFKL